jgi:hypothetical protein
MSAANDALLLALAQDGYPLVDDLAAPNTTQQLATRCFGVVSRFTTSTASATASAILPSLNTNEAPPIMFVINDSPNTIRTYPFTGETEGGVANAALSIPAGQSGIFVKITAAAVGKGGGQLPGSFANDWRIAVIP